MSTFSTETLTVIGAQLLASATANDRLVIDGCNAYTTVYSVAQAQAVTSVPASELSNTTDATLIGATDNHVQIRAAFHAGVSASGDGNTLMVYGHRESNPNAVYVIYVASDASTFHIPSSSEVATVFACLFDITYNADPSAVTSATNSTYTSLAEFNTLKERTVTTHKEGQNNVGEDQNILGNKTFYGNVTIMQGSKLYLSNVENSSGNLSLSSKNNSDTATILIGSNPPEIVLDAGSGGIVAAVNDTTIGRLNHPWSNTYSKVFTSPLTDDEYTSSSSSIIFKGGNTKYADSGCLLVTADYVYSGSFGSYEEPETSTIIISSTINDDQDTPKTDVYIKLYNDALNVTSKVVIGTQYGDSTVRLQVLMNEEVSGDLSVTGYTSLNSGCYVSGNISTHSNLLVDGYVSIGDTLSVTGNTTLTGNLSVGGIIQGITPDTTTTIPVGSFALVLINPIQSLTHFNAGEILDNNDIGILSMYFAKTKTSGSSCVFESTSGNLRPVTLTSSMRFILINDIQQNGYSVALVMRTV